MSAFPSVFENDYAQNNEKAQTELHRVQKEGELAGTVSHQFFKGGYDQANKKPTELDMCPAIVLKSGKAKTEGGKPTQYKVPINTVARLEHLTPIQGVCEITDDGRFKVLATVEYMKSSDKGEKLFSDWAKENYEALYDENDQRFDERTRSQLKNYVDPTGEIAKETYVRLSPNSEITLKCKDDGAASIFREKLKHTNLFKVRKHTKLNLTNISVIAWVYMKEETILGTGGGADATATAAQGTKQVVTPHITYWLKPGKVELAPGEENYKSIAAKMRENETPDKHSMAYPPLVVSGQVQVPSSAYFLVRNNYSTSIPVQNPGQLGVSIRIEPARKPEDVLYTDQELNKVKLITRDLTVYQWTGSPVDGHAKYLVQIKGPRDNGKLAEKYGIVDPETYGLIMYAHHDVTHHAICTLWWGATFRNTPGNAEEALKRDDTGTSGYYKYVYEDLIPDYYLYFEEDHGAIQISRELCAELFELFVGTIKRTGATQLTLRNMDAINPVNVDGTQSEVLLLGRPDHQVFNGDAWPAICNGRLYVMTSHILSPEERATICGRNADTKAADKRFRELLKIPGFTYMVFVVQGAPAETKKTGKAKPMQEEEEEEAAAAPQQEEQPKDDEDPFGDMEEENPFEDAEQEEEEEPEPAPVKKSTKGAAPKRAVPSGASTSTGAAKGKKQGKKE